MSVIDGKPVGGLSAGDLLVQRRNSDWPQYENMPNVLTVSLRCLGLVDSGFAPHTKTKLFDWGSFAR